MIQGLLQLPGKHSSAGMEGGLPRRLAPSGLSPARLSPSLPAASGTMRLRSGNAKIVKADPAFAVTCCARRHQPESQLSVRFAYR